MEKHPKAGQPVKIANGPLAGKYYVVHDWLVNQFQGKTIEGIIANKAMAHHLEKVTARKYPLDANLVWGRLYPTMDWTVTHDDELRVAMQVIEGNGEKVELPPNVESMSKKRKPKAVKKKEEKDDPGTAG